MKVSLEKFKSALQRYVFENIAPSVGGFGAQFLVGAMYGLYERNLGEKLGALGLVDTDGNVDIDGLERAVSHGFKASKDRATFCFAGTTFTFKPDDWRAFRQLL